MATMARLGPTFCSKLDTREQTPLISLMETVREVANRSISLGEGGFWSMQIGLREQRAVGADLNLRRFVVDRRTQAVT